MQRKAAGEELKRWTQFTPVLVGEPLRLTLQRQCNYEKQRQFIEFSYLITLKHIPQQFSSSVCCLPDNWTSGPGCCVISPTSCSFFNWKVVLREPLYPPPKSKNFFHQDHSWGHIFQGPHEDITSVTNNWEASYESHYPFNAICTLGILSIVVNYSTVKLNGRYSIRFSIGETRHSLTKPKDKLLPKSKQQIAKCNLMSPTCNSFNH